MDCRLKYVPRPTLKVCILGDQQHCDEADANSLPRMNVDDLKKFNKDKKLIKNFGKPGKTISFLMP